MIITLALFAGVALAVTILVLVPPLDEMIGFLRQHGAATLVGWVAALCAEYATYLRIRWQRISQEP